MFVELRPSIDVRCLDRVEKQLGNADSFDIDEMRLEKCFRRLKSLATHLYDASIGQLETKFVSFSLLKIKLKINFLKINADKTGF